MNAQQIYELVKGWEDQWPEGLEYTAEEWRDDLIDMPIQDKIAERAFIDRACELAECGVAPICEGFQAFDEDGNGMGFIVRSRLAAACEGLKCRKAREAKKKGGAS